MIIFIAVSTIQKSFVHFFLEIIKIKYFSRNKIHYLPRCWPDKGKDLMEGKLFQRCAHLLYCSVLSLGSNVNTRRMSKPDMGSIFHINKQWNILVKGNYYVNYQNSMLLTSSDTKRTLRHLFLFTNSARRELVSICAQSTIHNCN